MEIGGCGNELNAWTKALEYTYRTRHVHRGSDEQNPFESSLLQDRIQVSRMLVGVLGFLFSQDAILWDTKLLKEFRHILRGWPGRDPTGSHVARAKDAPSLSLPKEMGSIQYPVPCVGDLYGGTRRGFGQGSTAQHQDAVGLRQRLGRQIFPFEMPGQGTNHATITAHHQCCRGQQ
jgi:hypothetical protein